MTGSDEWLRTQAGSFGAAAATYERVRPSYPDQAVGWLLPPGARRVLDLGAGTGKLTRGLRDRGLEVIAVEPSAGMRGQLARVLPGVPVLAGTAEQIPVADSTADALLVAQAWHWVDKARAVPEAARVLVPGGWLGLLWNFRDERVDWVAELSRIMHSENPGDTAAAVPAVGPPFGPVELFEVEWTRQMAPAEIIDLVASRSYIITLPPGDRAAVLSRVQRLLDTHPGTAGATRISLPYVTKCYRTALNRGVSPRQTPS